ncbi:uncharacterized protein [Watersipora subatra]|uniref:uncharacterized protein n=1 Tax=Watersipora subatra TaxID=2589382 RepID=UPI00355B7755
MIIANIKKKNEVSTKYKPEVIVFEEPGVKLKNKAPGKGHSKKVLSNREKALNRKVEKIYKEERSKGDALPAVLKDLELSSSLRTEVFELGASQMELERRGKAVQNWKKRRRNAKEMLEKWTPVDKSTISYPKLIEKAFEEKAELFAAKEREFQGDDPVARRKMRKHKSGTDVPSHLFGKHLSRTKVGKFKEGVLKLTNQDLRNVKFRSAKRRR